MICGFGLRVKRALRSNVLHLNTLDYSRWNEITKQEDWNDTYNEGFKKLKKLQPKGSNDYSQFQFDLVMANPPFAGDIKENTIISRYELGKNSAGKWQNKVGRDILFIERNLNFLKPGGRMAIVEAFKLHYENNAYGKRLLVKIGNLEKRIISLIWQIFDLNAKDETFKTPDEMGRSRNTYELIQQRPLNYFQYHFDVNLTPQRDLSASEKEWFRKLHESRRQNSVLWFLDFVYRLRNALFHEIIDPLDEEWQVIFKNAYLVLKEIVDLNIAAIETR